MMAEIAKRRPVRNSNAGRNIMVKFMPCGKHVDNPMPAVEAVTGILTENFNRAARQQRPIYSH